MDRCGWNFTVDDNVINDCLPTFLNLEIRPDPKDSSAVPGASRKSVDHVPSHWDLVPAANGY